MPDFASWLQTTFVVLTVRYLCDPRSRRSSAQTIWEAVLDGFAQADDIDFAYPTKRFYDNRIEGKPGAGGPDSEKPPNRWARQGI
ncbi:MAG TPA: hypothetical protein VGA37_12380 [Gemmatimonadales bacterium]